MAKTHCTQLELVRKTYRFRAYPRSPTVAQRLEHALNLCRNLYNCALEERRKAWSHSQASVDYYDQQNQLPQIKRDLPEYRFVHSQVLQDVLRRLDKTFKAFFQRCRNGEKPGYPRFKGRGRYRSFTYPQDSGWKLDGSRLCLHNIGTLKLRLHRQIPVNTVIKTVTVQRKAGKWYVSFSVLEPQPKPLPQTGQEVGVDVGLESFATLSDGTQIENPGWYRETEQRLKTLHKALSRKKRGSRRWRKTKRELQRAYEKVSNQRRDFHHKLSRWLVDNHDVVCHEKLHIRNMVRNGRLAKSIADAGWGQFLQFVRYKAENAGRDIVEVDPKLTSQVCHNCGELVRKGLSQRWHLCPYCGASLHRDHNSAREILRRGTGARRDGRLQPQFAGAVPVAEARSPWL